ncbi:MAG TPA: aminotransferase class IV [Pirellulaceae bacterium]|nr:aminotransferase class IV [Pirellulaceae bacterium]
MPQPVAYLNGQILDSQSAVIPVTDAGFVQGVTVAEQLRTFGGKLFRLEKHLARLAHSLEIIGVDPGMPLAEIGRVAEELAARNHALLDPADDLGLSIFVTPGTYGAFSAAVPASGPTIGMHTYPLPFHLWHDKYERGQSLVVSSARQVPTACWPAELKCRSRMHYYLADKEAREREPGARALLLDESGQVVEASTANVLIFVPREGLVSPPREVILPGVSVGMLEELAAALKIPFVHRRLAPADIAAAGEVMLCSTSPCVWPVTRLNGQPIRHGRCGPVVKALLDAWSKAVGVEIAAQAARFAARSTPNTPSPSGRGLG